MATYPPATKLYELQTLLANSTVFKTWAGAATEAAARLKAPIGAIYNETGAPARPFVCLLDKDTKFKRKAAGDKYYAGGDIVVCVEGVISAVNANDNDAAALEMLDAIGLLMAEIITAVQPTYLLADEVSIQYPATFEASESKSDVSKRYVNWYAELLVHWGADR